MGVVGKGRPKLANKNDPSHTRGEVFTPIPLINEMLDMLPKSVWNNKQRFLDPAAGDSRILNEIHKRGIPKKNLYAVELDPMNIRNAVIKGINMHQGNALEFNFWGIPLSDFIIVANPPFVEFGNGDINATKQLYDKFYNIIRQGTYFITVISSKWAGKCNSKFREIVLDSATTIVECRKHFPTVSSFTMIVYLSNVSEQKYFVNTLGEKLPFDWFYDDIIPLRCPKNKMDQFLELRNQAQISNYTKFWDDGFRISQFDTRIKEKPFKDSLTIVKTTGERTKPPRFGYISKSDFENFPDRPRDKATIDRIIGSWKLLFNRNGSVDRISTTKVLEPGIICSQSCNFLVARDKKHAEEMKKDLESLKKYIGWWKTTTTNGRETFQSIPYLLD